MCTLVNTSDVLQLQMGSLPVTLRRVQLNDLNPNTMYYIRASAHDGMNVSSRPSF